MFFTITTEKLKTGLPINFPHCHINSNDNNASDVNTEKVKANDRKNLRQRKIKRYYDCCAIDTQALLIGYFNLVLAFIYIAPTAVLISTSILRVINVTATDKLPPRIDTGAFIISVTVVSILYVLMTIIFTYGTVRRNPNYVFLFLCFNFMQIFSNITYTIGYVGALFTFGDSYRISEIIVIFLIAFIVSGLQIIMWRVVYRFYKEIYMNQTMNEIRNDEIKIHSLNLNKY